MAREPMRTINSGLVFSISRNYIFGLSEPQIVKTAHCVSLCSTTRWRLAAGLVILNYSEVTITPSPNYRTTPTGGRLGSRQASPLQGVAAVAKWYRYRIVACLLTCSSTVPLKTHRVGQRCTLNLSRAETSFRWCGVVVRRWGASSGVVHVT
ncbi:uncharacterized protein TNCV_1333251 [Trichonephila clavipes]|nr:uncharacterized protein TNCV_1333251 [Trichonephila clavipes]